ncbi:phosphoglucomutase/phosphomannomutase, alpha/beta/alpha domain I [Winkia neuii]|nr:phosphoglucomutase/phosphomannomutase, alpha/beta/alpha domain I [Winkia neuii]
MDLLGQAADWARHDPDPVTKAQLEHTLELARAGSKAAVGELQEAFAGPLQFGTAGLRGRLGPGCARMNEAVVVRATAGLMAWLNQQVEAPKVVVGCDARHGSAQFAQAVAEVVAAAGGNAVKLPEAGPTPVTAFAVRALNADAGVMVTASHNPAQDNGYKVYLGGRVATGVAQGVQIVPPRRRANCRVHRTSPEGRPSGPQKIAACSRRRNRAISSCHLPAPEEPRPDHRIDPHARGGRAHLRTGAAEGRIH